MSGRYLLDTNAIINLLNKKIKEEAIELKKKNTIKLPDAVICATALVSHLTLVTDDDRLFNIEGLNVIHLSDLIDKFTTINSTSVEREI